VVKQKTPPKSIVGRAATYIVGVLNAWMNAYPSLDPARKEIFNGWRPRYGTANQTISPNALPLSAQCRHLERMTPMARAVCEGLSADIVGKGISILPNSGDTERDARLLAAFYDWADCAMADGSSLWAWQTMIPRELGTSGGALARFVILEDRAKKGMIPLALVPLEVEWLATYAVGPIPDGHRFIRPGKVVDKFGRIVAYHLRNPELLYADAGEVVPAEQIIDIFEKRRPQQTHGEPLLAPVVERLLQDGRLIETELKAAVATAAPAVAITTESEEGGDEDEDGEAVTDIPSGATVRLRPKEGIEVVENKRPSQQIAPFRQTIRADVAAACRVSQYSLDHDPSRANFSSMRQAAQESDRQLVSLKEVVGRGGCGKPYEAVFQWLLLIIGERKPANAVELARMMRYDLRPDERPYVDPTKDVQASINAIAHNLSTFDIELSARGKDFRSIFRQCAVEKALLESSGFKWPQPVKSPNATVASVDADEEDADDLDGKKKEAA
jgi:lambda family phage portal protein